MWHSTWNYVLWNLQPVNVTLLLLICWMCLHTLIRYQFWNTMKTLDIQQSSSSYTWRFIFRDSGMKKRNEYEERRAPSSIGFYRCDTFLNISLVFIPVNIVFVWLLYLCVVFVVISLVFMPLNIVFSDLIHPRAKEKWSCRFFTMITFFQLLIDG